MASPILSLGLQHALLKAINEQYKNRDYDLRSALV